MVHRLRSQMRDQKTEISKQRNHVIICGVNRMLNKIIEELQYLPDYRRVGIVVVAELEEPPALSPKVRDPGSVYFMQGDYTKLNVLREAGLSYARIAILLADKSRPRSDQDRDARTVLAAMLIERERQKQGEEIFTCVELLNRDNKEQLKALDVEEVVLLDDYGGSIIAASSVNEGMMPVFNELFTRGWGNAFAKHPIFEQLVGKSVLEATCWLKEQKNAVLLGVERRKEGRREVVVNPKGSFRLRADDQLVVVADIDQLE
jgi:voltage-gated potassium channel